MSIVFFGTPRFSVPSLKTLLDAGEDVSAVVTRPDKRAGRGKQMHQTPVKELALERGLDVLQPTKMKDPAFVERLKGYAPEFFVVVAYGRIITPEMLAIPTRGTVNLHASILPKYRGASPIAWAIINGDSETALTTMLMNEGLDEGDVLIEERFVINDDDTTESLSARLSGAGGDVLLRTLRGMREGTVTPRPQEGQTTYAPLLKKDDGLVDWTKPAREIYNFVRGMYPWPAAFSFLGDRRIKLFRVAVEEGSAEPGAVAEVRRDAFTVGTGEGLIVVEELQPEGKRPMATRDFLSGHRLAPGARLA
jgi:methionyl-tRNA formyltransferase